MPKLVSLPASANTDEILDVLKRDGALIVTNVLDADDLKQLRAEIDPYVEATAFGRDNFTGSHTTRTGALVARSREKAANLRDASNDPQSRKQILQPYCENSSFICAGIRSNRAEGQRSTGRWAGHALNSWNRSIELAVQLL